tara:strand:+ start:330 stop:869 length:540 start_codon:yes stop_codon:yes gene_type:complete
MNRIEIYDNFFSKEDHKKIWESLAYKPRWSFTGGAGGVGGAKFWHLDNLEKEKYFNEYLFEKICSNIDTRKFGKVRRIYANGQTGGQWGYPHRDDGDITFLYYPNLDWKLDWQGHLVFIDGKGDIAETVVYRPNRAVLFPAHVMHYATAPHTSYMGIRISLAYKFWNTHHSGIEMDTLT